MNMQKNARLVTTPPEGDKLEPTWHPIGWFPANSDFSEDLKSWLGSVDWMQLGPDFPPREVAATDSSGNSKRVVEVYVPPVCVALGQSDDGRLICTGLIIGEFGPFSFGAKEVTARVLREIRIPELIDIVSSTRGRGDKAAQFLDNIPVRRQPPGGNLKHLEAVAHAYRVALTADPSRPTDWLRKNFGNAKPEDERTWIAAATMRRWIKQAREYPVDPPLLGPSRPGKAGEYPAK